MICELKISTKYYKDIKEGKKTFELVKNNGKFNVNDIVILHEYDNLLGYTSRKIIKQISYIFQEEHGGLNEGFCILGFKNTVCVELKNIDLNETTLMDQLRRIEKENNEFETAIVKSHTNDAIEEFWDKVQSSLGALEKIGIKADIVAQDYPRHLKKISNKLKKDKV